MKPARPVLFDNADGLRLHGMMHEPEASRRKPVGILLLSPGVKMRVAPHRLYNRMAEHFAGLGYPVLRFDFHGLGDAEGEVPEKLLADLYGSVQIGRYVGDTRAAMEWMRREFGLERFIAAGLCGGAITGLLAARKDPRIVGLLGLGIPVILDSAQADKSRFLTQGQMDRLQRGYFSKLLDPQSWFRLLTFQSDYRVIWRILRRRFAGPAPDVPESGGDAGHKEEDDNTNPLFAPAFFDMVDSGRQILFIFSGSDRLDWEYEEKFARRHAERLAGAKDCYEVTTIPEANHILSMPEWQQSMLRLCDDWLARHFA